NFVRSRGLPRNTVRYIRYALDIEVLFFSITQHCERNRLVLGAKQKRENLVCELFFIWNRKILCKIRRYFFYWLIVLFQNNITWLQRAICSINLFDNELPICPNQICRHGIFSHQPIDGLPICQSYMSI